MPPVDSASLGESRPLQLPGGHTVGYSLYGDPEGSPVLALHGAPSSRLMFEIADAPARRLGLAIHAPDRPGYGLTPMDERPALASRAEHLVQVADALGLDRFAVLGVSGGGPYAVALAARLGPRITTLALVSPVGPVADIRADTSMARNAAGGLWHRFVFLHLPRFSWGFDVGARLAALLFGMAPDTAAKMSSWTLGRADRRIVGRPEVRASLVRSTKEALRHGSDGSVADMKIYGAPWAVDYRRIVAPSVLWQGRSDTIVPPAASFRLGALIPGCRIVSVAGAGHFWVYDHVEDVLARVRAMIDEAAKP